VLDIETVQLVTTKLEIPIGHEDYMNKQHGVFIIRFRHVINTRTFYENLCECVCAISI